MFIKWIESIWQIYVPFLVFRIKKYHRVFCYFTHASRFTIETVSVHFNAASTISRSQRLTFISSVNDVCAMYVSVRVSRKLPKYMKLLLAAFEPDKFSAAASTSRPRIETSFLPRDARACNFLESLSNFEPFAMSANRAGHSAGIR